MYKVLIIDDDKLARKGIISIVPWEECGLEVVGDVANGALALEFVEQHEVDLAVVDLAMPVLSGIEFIQECRKRKPNIRYVVLTAYESFAYVQKALRLGVLDYISKMQLDQEDCVTLFRRAAEQIREGRQEMMPQQPQKEAEHAEEMQECYRIIDSLTCYYNQEKMKTLQKRMAEVKFSRRERYRLMLHSLHVMEQNFLIRLDEAEFDSNEEECGWIIKQREALLREVKKMRTTANMQVSVLLACMYIVEHLNEHELTAEAVGNELNLSRSYFSTSFKKCTGYSVNSYIRKERVERAKEILEKEPGLPFGEAADRVGYLSEKYFAKVFEEWEGMSPAEYKKRRKNAL